MICKSFLIQQFKSYTYFTLFKIKIFNFFQEKKNLDFLQYIKYVKAIILKKIVQNILFCWKQKQSWLMAVYIFNWIFHLPHGKWMIFHSRHYTELLKLLLKNHIVFYNFQTTFFRNSVQCTLFNVIQFWVGWVT